MRARLPERTRARAGEQLAPPRARTYNGACRLGPRSFPRNMQSASPPAAADEEARRAAGALVPFDAAAALVPAPAALPSGLPAALPVVKRKREQGAARAHPLELARDALRLMAVFDANPCAGGRRLGAGKACEEVGCVSYASTLNAVVAVMRTLARGAPRVRQQLGLPAARPHLLGAGLTSCLTLTL